MCHTHGGGWKLCVPQFDPTASIRGSCLLPLSHRGGGREGEGGRERGRSGRGVFISEVVVGGAAELDGRLMQGDQILSVNGEQVRHAHQEAVAAMLKVQTKHI